MIQESACRIGKVVAVNRRDHTVDIAPFNGPILRRVPVLTGTAGTTFGVAGLAAPSYDPEAPARKTHPTASHPRVDPDTNREVDGHAARDVYCAYIQLGGDAQGRHGHVALGFLYPMTSEMLFQGPDFDDLMVYRHPSDVQVTVDKAGKVSVEHPSGARVTIGEDAGPANLDGRDADGLYRRTHNLGQSVKVRVRDSFGDVVDLDANGTVTVYARRDVSVHAGRDIQGRAGRNVALSAGEEATVQADGSATVRAGATAQVSADGPVVVHSRSFVEIKAPSVAINPPAATAEIQDAAPAAFEPASVNGLVI